MYSKITYTVRSRWKYDSQKVGEGVNKINVVNEVDGGGCLWEFSIVGYEFGSRDAIQIRIFDDALAALAEFGEFFYQLRAQKINNLADVERLLRELGAVEGKHATYEAVNNDK